MAERILIVDDDLVPLQMVGLMQERLETPVILIIMPSPEDIHQANRKKTTVVTEFPDSSLGQQYKKRSALIVDLSTKIP